MRSLGRLKYGDTGRTKEKPIHYGSGTKKIGENDVASDL